MLHLYENGIEVLRKKANSKNLDIYWNNYSLVVWNKNDGGFFSTSGAYRNNSWGIKKEFLVNEKGAWALPSRYVKYFR
jgi:hypothetical protein